uniref:Cupin-like domain-containing protein n=1 Tax=viral metagenome TaxID=1070528 RepID=A0A6C0HM37_9ZZZZ
MLAQHLPIIYQREIYAWKYFNKLVGLPLAKIQATIAAGTPITPTTITATIDYSEIIKQNLEPNNLPMSYDWSIDMRNIVLTETSAICFIKQSNYMQLFGCVSGEMRIIISPPDQAPLLGTFINNVSNFDATKLLDKVPIELQFVEIILRCGNMIYIPYDWHYFIYKNSLTSSIDNSANNKANTAANTAANVEIADIDDIDDISDTIIIDCLNKSILCSI